MENDPEEDGSEETHRVLDIQEQEFATDEGPIPSAMFHAREQQQMEKGGSDE